MAKRPFIRKQKRRTHGMTFWDTEYTSGGHLKLSEAPAEDFLKFLRWLERETGRTVLNPTNSAVDFGCGNGRHLLYLAETYGMHGAGFDISSAAIKIARLAGVPYNLTFEARTIAGVFPSLADESQSLTIDMMTSHFLSAKERLLLRDEIFRVMKPGAFLIMKTHLLDGDLHSRRLLAEAPAREPGSYIHPVMGVAEHVYSEEELIRFLEEKFVIRKIYRSHRHISRGKARKRRTISVYAEKPAF